jgi:hypothetical protein
MKCTDPPADINVNDQVAFPNNMIAQVISTATAAQGSIN